MKILRKSKRTELRVEKWVNEKPDWHKWFAWFPVRECYKGDWLWLQVVERQRDSDFILRDRSYEKSYVYREIKK